MLGSPTFTISAAETEGYFIVIIENPRSRPGRKISRRKLIASGVACAAVGSVTAISPPTLGLIMPVDAEVPPEAATMYPVGIRFRCAAVGLKEMTPQGYDQVVGRIAPVAKDLADEGAQAIVLMGTSLSFYQGAAFNRELTERVVAASGRPAVTMSTAVIEGLRRVGPVENKVAL